MLFHAGILRRETQTEDASMKRGRVRGFASQSQNELDTQNGIELKATWQNVD